MSLFIINLCYHLSLQLLFFMSLFIISITYYFFWPMISDQLARGLGGGCGYYFIYKFIFWPRCARHLMCVTCDHVCEVRGCHVCGTKSRWRQSFGTQHFCCAIKINFYDTVLCDHNFGFNYVRLCIFNG
jgi:hypothetical protein